MRQSNRTDTEVRIAPVSAGDCTDGHQDRTDPRQKDCTNQ